MTTSQTAITASNAAKDDFANSKITVCINCKNRRWEMFTSDGSTCGALTNREATDPVTGEAMYVDRNHKLTYSRHPACETVNTGHCELFIQDTKNPIRRFAVAFVKADLDYLGF